MKCFFYQFKILIVIFIFHVFSVSVIATARETHTTMAANPRKFSEKIALHNQKQAAETVEFEKIMKEVKDATSKVRSP